MTLDELITRLTEIRDEVGGDAEVKLAYQPSYPLMMPVGPVAAVTGPNGGEVFDDGPVDESDETYTVVYIGQGEGRAGYLSGEASEALGWR